MGGKKFFLHIFEVERRNFPSRNCGCRTKTYIVPVVVVVGGNVINRPLHVTLSIRTVVLIISSFLSHQKRIFSPLFFPFSFLSEKLPSIHLDPRKRRRRSADWVVSLQRLIFWCLPRQDRKSDLLYFYLLTHLLTTHSPRTSTWHDHYRLHEKEQGRKDGSSMLW